jgi:hypothetical protein
VIASLSAYHSTSNGVALQGSWAVLNLACDNADNKRKLNAMRAKAILEDVINRATTPDNTRANAREALSKL